MSITPLPRTALTPLGRPRRRQTRTTTRPSARSTGTKPSFKTTEFFDYIATVVGVLVTSIMLGSNEGTSDFYGADKAWRYVTLLSIGYMVSRGLAKSGSREHHSA